MTTDNKTLADVQLGGRVRLGDQAERARFEAFLSGNPLIALSAGTAWQVWQAALSAQPSPGGQDGPAYEGHTWVSDYVLAALRERAAMPLQLRNGEIWHWQGDGHDFPESLVCPVIMSAETLRALLAARQPVGEPVVIAHRVHYLDGVTGKEIAVSPWMDGDGSEFNVIYAAENPTTRWIENAYDAPVPAQAVDLEQFRDAITREYANSRALCDMPRILECERLLALIDSHGARNG